MRDFNVVDLDGNELGFGMESRRQEPFQPEEDRT
jgi:hypothetical protein